MKNPPFRKNIWSLCIALVLIHGAAPSRAQDFEKVANQLAARIHAAKHSRVTVIDFVDLDSKPSRLGKFMALQLQRSLAKPEHKLMVVDQSELSHLMDQIEKLNEGLLDPETGQELGRMAGTQVIIKGSVMPSSMTIRVDIQAIDLETAKLLTGVTAKVARLSSYEKLLAQDAPQKEPEIPSASVQLAVQPQKPSQGPARTHRDQGMRFDLEGCSLSGSGLRCAFTVTSERDRWLAVYERSRAWNHTGEEFEPGEIAIANTRSSNTCALKQILKSVPTPLSLTFPSFGDDVESVERLRLYWKDEENCYAGGIRSFDVEKIALSADTERGSTASRPSKGERDAPEKGKQPGGVLQRIGRRVRDAAEDAATNVIDRETRKYTKEDEEEEEEDDDSPPRNE